MTLLVTDNRVRNIQSLHLITSGNWTNCS